MLSHSGVAIAFRLLALMMMYVDPERKNDGPFHIYFVCRTLAFSGYIVTGTDYMVTEKSECASNLIY